MSSSDSAPASKASTSFLSCESRFGYSGGTTSEICGACSLPPSPCVSESATKTADPRRIPSAKIDRERTTTPLSIETSFDQASSMIPDSDQFG